MKKSIAKLWPFIIFAFALLVRFIFLAQFKNNPFFFPQVNGLDPYLYHNLAKCLAGGYWPGDKLLYSHPFYPYLVSFFYRFYGPDPRLIIIIQLFMGAFSCVLVYFIAKYIFSPPVGIVSSFLMALYGPILFYEGVFMPNTLSIFLNLSAVMMLFNIFDVPNLRRTFLGGLLLGCSLITNSGIAPFIFILIFWIAWMLKPQKKALFAHLVCFVVGITLSLALLSLKHFVAEGHFDFFGAHGGINFYAGNNPSANGCFSTSLGFMPSAEGLSEESARYAQKATGRQLTAIEVSEFWYKKAFIYIKQHPFLWIKLLFRKFVLFYNGIELGDVVDYYLSKNYSLLLKFNPFTFGIIAPFGLLGMILAWQHFRKAFFLYMGVFSFMISCILFFVNSRYRLSAVPFLIIFAGFAIFRIWQNYKAKNFRQLGIYIAALMLFFTFSNIKVMAADTVTPLYNLSVIYAEKGLYDQSIDISRRLLAQNPNLAAVHFNLGVCYYAKGMVDEAISEFNQTLRLNPNDYNAHFNLGVIYCKKKDYAKALEEFKHSLTMTEEDVIVHYNLGLIYQQQDKLRQALDEYKAALKIAPDSVQIKKAIEGLRSKIKSRKR